MQIPINKDLEEAYKDEFMKGFTLREIGYLSVSVILIAGVTGIAWWKFGVSPDIGVFMGLPFGIPTLFIGFKKYQGLTVPAYAKEMLYEYRTRVLTYDADELPEDNRIFTMRRSRVKRKRRGGK